MSETRPAWDIPSSWQPAIEAARAGGALVIIGAIDTGKSTLAAVLANTALDAGRSVAIVDADVGQSSIGPPACVGLARPDRPIAGLAELAPEAIDFVAACSPARHLLQFVASVSSLAARARTAAPEAIIIDTTGLVSGGVGRALKAAKIRLLDPDVLVALQEDDEVEHLIAPYERRPRPTVLRLRPSPRVRARAREERAANRQRNFNTYFRGGGTVSLDWREAPIENSAWTGGEPLPGHLRAYAEERVACEVLHAERHGEGVFLIVDGHPDPNGLRSLGDSFEGRALVVEQASLRNLLVGLLDESGGTLALAILEEVDFRARRMALYTPLAEAGAVRGVRLGSIQLARDGTQLGTVDVSGE